VKINLGAGSRPMAGYINVDRVNLPRIDIVHDLDVCPWPFEDGRAQEIYAKDIFEHVVDPILFMTECHRILEPAGTLIIRTPHISSLDAFTDPTHKRFPTEFTFDYWVPGTIYHTEHNAAYGAVSFVKSQLGIQDGSMMVYLLKIEG
jgi:hypothetical protein